MYIGTTQRYRIYTENVNYKDVVELATQKLQSGSFTTYTAKGHWKGQSENSLIIEYVGPDAAMQDVRGLAFAIKKLNKQEAVMITTDSVEVEII